MNEDVKKEWLKALRSGKYSQATGRLRKGNNFCCLGVLCDITKDTSKMDWVLIKDSIGDIIFGFGTFLTHRDYLKYETLPAKVSLNAGLHYGSPTISLKDREDRKIALAHLNDAGFTFDQIADVIEYFL